VIDASIQALPFGWDVTPTQIRFFEMPPNQQRWTIRALSIADRPVRFIGELGDSHADSDGMRISVSRDGNWMYYPRLRFVEFQCCDRREWAMTALQRLSGAQSRALRSSECL
jgi:hypothetical protein